MHPKISTNVDLLLLPTKTAIQDSDVFWIQLYRCRTLNAMDVRAKMLDINT